MREAIVPFDFKEALSQSTTVDLIHYPIKSCAGIRTNIVHVGPTGVMHDRELMLVNSEGTFLSQRDPGCQRLALVRPIIHEGVLTIEAPNMPVFYMLITNEGERVETTIHGKPGTMTVDQGNYAQQWFGEFLGIDCRLVAMAPEYRRAIEAEYALSTQDHTGFADGFSTLVISDESLADLNTRLKTPLTMNRFRPNLVLSGSGISHGEDRIKRFKIGEVTFTVVKPSSRCVITTIDQERGEIDRRVGMKGEPLRTLMQYRAIARYDNRTGKPKQKALFGQNLVHENTGVIRVGDRIEVLEFQETPRFLDKVS